MAESFLKSTNLVQRVSLIFHCMFCRTIFHSQVLATVYPLLYIYKGGSANVYVMIASEAEI